MKTLVMVVVCLSVPSPMMATIYFNDGETHNINYTIDDWVLVDYETPNMQTTVNLFNRGVISKGTISNPYSLYGFNDSRINISGGSVGNDLSADDNCQVTISDGSVGKNLLVWKNSQVTISGGAIGLGMVAQDNSQITMSDGTITGEAIVYKNSNMNWSGGTIGKTLTLYIASTLTIYGSNFAIDGNLLGSDEIKSIFGGNWNNEPYRTLTGTLANGDIINNQFRIGNESSINLIAIPEPTSILAISGGLAIICLFYKRQ